MKKIIYFISIMFLAVSIKAISPEVNYQEGIYSNRIGDKLYSGQMAFMFMDGHIVYCLEPFEVVGRTYYEDSDYLNRFDEATIEYFELVAYYGYNSERNSIYHYMAAQEIIWEKILGGDYVYWTTGINGTGDRINIDSYKNEIIDNVNAFYVKPSFEEDSFSFPFFDEMVIYDQNNVFKDYNGYHYEGNNIVIKNDNGFKVSILEEGRQTIYYNKLLKTDNNTIVYTGRGNQPLASFGINKNITGEVYIYGRAYETRLNLIFYDNKTNERIDDVDFTVKNLDGNWDHEDGIYRYNTPIGEGKYNIEVNDYVIVSADYFIIKKEDLKRETTIEVYLEKKRKKPIIDEPIIDDEDIELLPNKNEELPNNDSEDEIKSTNPILNEIEESDNCANPNENKDTTSIIEESDNCANPNENKDTTSVIEESDDENKIFSELPNTSNYNFLKYILLIINVLIGIILYEKARD